MAQICHQCGTALETSDRFCARCGAAVRGEGAPKADPLVGRTVGGAYVLQELIGVGGMGRVYRAEQSALGRTVAVKVIHPHLLGDEQTVARFYTEARAASRLNHPNSVSIIDFGRSDDGMLYLVMEFLQGKDLAVVMQEEGPLPIPRVCDVLIGVLGALGEAHALDVIHRDLKPENVILKRFRSGADLVKVVDFGLATIAGAATSSITTPGLVCGTPDYMSPEQGQGEDIDGRSDLYACGVVLYELLTDTLPFQDETPTKVVLRHIHDPVPSPQRTAPQRGISDALDGITRKALAKKAADRFQTAEEMRQALVEVVEAERQRAARRTACPSCGAPNPEQMRFCGSCGARIATSLAGAQRSPSVRPSVPPPPPAAERPLLGREAELAMLLGARAQAAEGTRWVHLAGEAGVGKSRLLAELEALAAAEGDVVVGVTPHASRAPVPLAPIRVLMGRLLERDEAALAEMLHGTELKDAMARAGLTEILAPSGLAGADGVGRAAAAAAAVSYGADVAVARAGSRRVVLCFDDLGQMDGLSQAVVRLLVADFGSRPGVLVVSTGEREVSGAENLVLVGLTTEVAARFLEVGARASRVAIPAALLDPSRRLLPLYLEQVAALGEEGDAVPARLADAVAARVERVGLESRRVLHAASVLGVRAARAALERLVPDLSATGLGRLVDHQLLRLEGDDVVFAHPFVADLVEASVPAEARRALHDRALKLAVEAGAPLEVRAEHAYRGNEPLTALVFLERMGDAALYRGDAASAVRAFRRALELGRREMLETGDLMLEQAMVTFSRKLGEALERTADVGGAEGVLREALDLAGPSTAERARMLIVLGRVALERGRRRDAMRSLGQALEVAAKLKDELLEASVFAGIARTREGDGDLAGALEALRRTVELRARAEDRADRRARALIELGELLIANGDHAEAMLRLSEADALAEGGDHRALRARAVGNMGTIDESAGRKPRALDRYRDASQLAAEAGDAPGHAEWKRRAHVLASAS